MGAKPEKIDTRKQTADMRRRTGEVMKSLGRLRSEQLGLVRSGEDEAEQAHEGLKSSLGNRLDEVTGQYDAIAEITRSLLGGALFGAGESSQASAAARDGAKAANRGQRSALSSSPLSRRVYSSDLLASGANAPGSSRKGNNLDSNPNPARRLDRLGGARKVSDLRASTPQPQPLGSRI